MVRECVDDAIPKNGIQNLRGVKNGLKEWPSQNPNASVPLVGQDAEGEMVDVDGKEEIVGSDDEGEVVIQGAASGGGDDGSPYVPSQNGDVLQSGQGSFTALEHAQVSVFVYHNFGVDLICTFKVSGSITPVMTKTDMREKQVSETAHHSNATAKVFQPRPERQHEAPDEMAMTNTQVK